MPFAILEKGKPVPQLEFHLKSELAQNVVERVNGRLEAPSA